MASVRSVLYLAFSALAAPYVYERYVALSSQIANRPAKIQSFNSFKSQELRFGDVVRNCEDVILEEALGVAFLSCDPGRDHWNTVMATFQPPSTKPSIPNHGGIFLYDYATPNLPQDQALRQLTLKNYPSSPPDLHPLGIAFEKSTSKLYIINHSRFSGSIIDIFTLNIATAEAHFVQTFTHPLLHAPNALHLLGDGKMYVSNDHYLLARTNTFLAKFETFAAIPGGSVVYVDVHDPAATKVVARAAFPNGVVTLNSTTAAVASSAKLGVYLYDVTYEKNSAVVQSWTYKAFIRTPALPDNLSVDSRGTLLIAGHPFAPSLMAVAGARAECDVEGSEAQRKACECWAGGWVGEWSEAKGLKTLAMDGNGATMCTSSTAVRDAQRGVGMVSMLYGRGVVVFKE